ncbi:MAG: DUF1659 domain-containing protein [Syntrophomonadaceae bacterium]|nr:DUF1659 domain-containing protein [Syntrophomonadaceae bacterium]MDD3022445.1 DUF1659 domain-containing protein [Syntrophomonadaceae bacterium]
MALIATPISSNLVLVMDNGTGSSGQQLSIKRTFKSVKSAASNDDLYDVAQDIIGLQGKSNLAVQRQDTVELENV